MKVKFTQITGSQATGLYALDEQGSVWERTYHMDEGATWVKLGNPQRDCTPSSGRAAPFSQRTAEPI
jgi:hypothetical protein